MLKGVLAEFKRPLHVTLVGVDTRPPISVLQRKPSPTSSAPASSPSHSQTHSEEGEVVSSASASSATTGRPKPAHLDRQPTTFSFTPSEPIAFGSGDSHLLVPASTYLIHVPRIPSLAHTLIEPFMPTTASNNGVSVLGVHFLLAHRSKTSSLDVTLEKHVRDVRQSFTELASLGKERWGTSGRMPCHLEAVASVEELIAEFE